MRVPIILAIIAAFLVATTNHIDKYLISKAANTDYRALTIISTIIAGSMMVIVYLFICQFNLSMDFPSILILLVGSMLSTLALIAYFKALNRDDTTTVIIMFQLLPVFILLLQPLFLPSQSMSISQLAGGFIVVLAAIFLTYQPDKKKFGKTKLITLGLMTFSSVAFALRYILERSVTLGHDFNLTIFWDNATLLLVGVVLILIKPYRRSFMKMLKTNGLKVIGLNLINEVQYSLSTILSVFAGTMAPIALVSFISQGLQPFAVLVIGILITKFFPRIEKENISKKVFIKRAFTILLCLTGLALIYFG